MNATEVRSVMGVLTGAWPWFPGTDEVTRLWRSELDSLGVAAALSAAHKLAASEDRMPSLAAFLRATRTEQRLLTLSSRSVGAPYREPCGLCDDTGWARAGVVSDAFAVVRCRCSAGRVSDHHPSGCTCRVCHYGADEAGAIAAGPRRTAQDPLAQRGGQS